MLSLATRTEPTGLAGTGIELNDVHSRLNATRVGTVIRPAGVAGAVEAVRAAAHVGEPLAVMGARHAMGGQQFLFGGRVPDLGALERVTAFDDGHGLVTVEAGIGRKSVGQGKRVSVRVEPGGRRIIKKKQ